jgi:hypothetical protein
MANGLSVLKFLSPNVASASAEPVATPSGVVYISLLITLLTVRFLIDNLYTTPEGVDTSSAKAEATTAAQPQRHHKQSIKIS